MSDQTPRPKKAAICSSFCAKAAGTAFAVALALFIGIYVTVKLAEKERPWQNAMPNPGMSKEDARAALLRAKLLYEAKVSPALQRAMDKFPGLTGPSAAQTAEYLWQARFAPEAQKRLLGAILSAKDAGKLNAALKDAGDFARMTRQIAEKIQCRNADCTQAPRAKRGPLPLPKLPEQEKFQEEVFGKAALIAAALWEAKTPLRRAAPYLDRLVPLAGDSKALRAAGLLLQKENIPYELNFFLLDKLAVSPAEALAAIANIEEAGKSNRRLFFAMDVEGNSDIIKLPLANIAPDAAKAFVKNKTIPLYASSFKRTGKLLHIRRLENPFVTDGKTAPPENGALAALKPGERLYTLERGENLVLAGTPLDILAPSGPALAEYARDAKSVSKFFSEGQPLWHPRVKYIIAAACGPEELRAHLASLMVVYSEREKSLYGPFEDFTWKENDAQQLRIPLDVMARDVPGETRRLADIRDPNFFLALAPLADKEGLARLMGPIRGIWVQNRPGDKTPWEELRYTPGGKPAHSALGQSPLLQLDKHALESIIARRKSAVTHAWASFLLRKELGKEASGDVKAAFADRLPEALQKTAARFDELARKGFVSPLDMVQAELYLRKAGNDAMLRKTLTAIRDDASLSSARRVRAMGSAFGEQ